MSYKQLEQLVTSKLEEGNYYRVLVNVTENPEAMVEVTLKVFEKGSFEVAVRNPEISNNPRRVLFPNLQVFREKLELFLDAEDAVYRLVRVCSEAEDELAARGVVVPKEYIVEVYKDKYTLEIDVIGAEEE